MKAWVSWVAIGAVVVGIVAGGSWQRWAQQKAWEREAEEELQRHRPERGPASPWATPTGMEWAHEGGRAGKMVGIGDQYVVGGVTCEVIEVKHVTDASGVVAFDETQVSLTVEKAAGVAMASVDDPRFAAFVMRRLEACATGEEERYCVGVYHPATGMRIAPSPPSEKPIIATLTMGWACPKITVKLNGVAQAGQFVTFVARRHVADQDGLLEYWYGADRFGVGGVDGEWETDANGIVRQNLNDGGALQQICFPSGEAALMQRQGDRRDEQAEQPEEYLSELWCYYQGCKVRVVEGQDVDLEAIGASIQVSGDANAFVYGWLWDTHDVGPTLYNVAIGVQLDGAGQGTLPTLIPGTYMLQQFKLDGGNVDWHYISPRERVTVGMGEAASVSLTPLASPPEGKIWIWVYDHDATAGSAEVYTETEVSETPTLLGSGSQIEINQTGGPLVLVAEDTGFYAFMEEGRTCYEAVLRARTLILCMDDEGGGLETVWWDSDDGHRDLQWMGPTAAILREADERQADAAFTQIHGGLISEPVYQRAPPEWEYDPEAEIGIWDFNEEDYSWDTVAANGESLGLGGGPLDKSALASGLVDNGPVEHDTELSTRIVAPALQGGKLAGDAVEGHGVRIGTGANPLPEAARMGLEWGQLPASIEVRVQAGNGYAGRVGETVCPACLGPVWRWPTLVATCTYGWCTDPGCAADARTYVRTPTVAAGAYDVRVTRQRPQGTPQAGTGSGLSMTARGGAGSRLSMRNGIRRTSVTLVKWLRPVDYAIGSGYIPVTHAVMATWSNGFIDGEDTGDIRTDNACDGAVYAQPKVLPNPYVRRVGHFEVDCIMADDSTRTFRVQVRPGSYAQPIVKRRKTEAAEAGGNPGRCGFIKDVTDIRFVSGEGGPLCPWQIVGDNPVLVDEQTPFEDAQETPWACQMLGLHGDPHLTVDGFGRIWLAFTDEGRIRVLVRDSPQRPWEERSPAFDEEDQFSDPCINCASDGRIYVIATRVGGKCVLRMSPDDGVRWQEPV